MSTVSVSIDRTSMSLAPLVISDDGAVYRFTEDGLGYVVTSVRVTSMPDSVDVDGSEPVTFSREATGLPLRFHVQGTSTATLHTAVAALEAALFRLRYEVTRTVDGVSTTYEGGPAALSPVRSFVDHGVLAAHFDTFAVTIPFFNPNPVTP